MSPAPLTCKSPEQIEFRSLSHSPAHPEQQKLAAVVAVMSVQPTSEKRTMPQSATAGTAAQIARTDSVDFNFISLLPDFS